jgi:hypothetical protein
LDILWFNHFLVFKLTLRYCDKYVFVFKLFQVEINYFIKVYPERKLFLTRFFKHICTLQLKYWLVEWHNVKRYKDPT